MPRSKPSITTYAKTAKAMIPAQTIVRSMYAKFMSGLLIGRRRDSRSRCDACSTLRYSGRLRLT